MLRYIRTQFYILYVHTYTRAYLFIPVRKNNNNYKKNQSK